MNRSLSERVLWTLAAIALAAGVSVSVWSLFRLNGHADRLRTYVDYSRRLSDMSRQAGRSESAVRIFEGLADPHPIPIPDLLKQSLPGEKYETREQPSQSTIPGWTVRRVSVTFPEIDLDMLAAFIVNAESGRPPWQIRSFTLRALSTSGRTGQATLILEALDRTP
ncbi:MAG: hypothetical protein E4H02_03985 [Lentisphaerales bacterium]|jgi:hypothetical protein|nr:MAG: hypothetical protein E4H02_03985 [Lentisphaerales bacterium]